MPTQLVAPFIVAVAVGAAHFAAHNVAGEESAFEEAGVTAAGLTVMVMAFGLTWALQNGWLDPAISTVQSLLNAVLTTAGASLGGLSAG